MDLRDFLIALVMGIVEGATEFIPVSSTGHLIVVGELLGFTGEKAATFEVVIQLGAVLAVVFLYRDRLRALQTLRVEPGFAGRRGLLLLALATFPALVVGAAAHSAIKEHLFSPTTVAIGWGLGGIAILLVERYRPLVRIADLDAIGWRQALAIGLFQCLALFIYGVLPTLQPPEAHFGRIYAAYGGLFVVLALIWGWWIDGVRPDRWDLIGGVIALAGVGVIMYAPRA
jgi:undecaprenyl-diphosphatase